MTLNAFNLSEQLASLQAQSLKRTPRALSHGVTPCIWRGGKEFLNFSSNDYLGIADHYALRDAVVETLNQHGIGAGAAHLITGHTELHEQLELRLALMSGYPRALLFSTGYMANMGVLDALLTPKSTVYQDKLNHASLIDGARLVGAVHRRYPHQDLVVLEHWLASDTSPLKLIATDQVFSMDGTEAQLEPLRHLADQYQAALMIDDAHGFAVRATPLPKVDVYMATLGKAVGTFGAFVAGSDELIEFLQSRARTFCFTTATPPLLAAATLAALDVIESESWRRTKLAAHIVRLRTALIEQGWLLTDSQTAIQPIIIGAADRALAISKWLEEQGVLAVAIRPPTVPVGTSRLRITLSAAHLDEDVERLIECLQQARIVFP
ncbi:aminotransferase class I/II-fold pyridoxal phosphate-dependent enzyme [Aquirhabdus parva]|uniref:8-amino-7-oxononanoate synthase n=1 Tax=Aquirhabdus parva TaxID=2283318 RepID=A0A345P834_9GAMM|nr:8-amino-7-oxononanoate synthase [Aquirhabdus parva]AXI03443.1 8-amino-7-oxononanoate synthase [Aquirhabdus parva]